MYNRAPILCFFSRKLRTSLQAGLLAHPSFWLAFPFFLRKNSGIVNQNHMDLQLRGQLTNYTWFPIIPCGTYKSKQC